MAVIGSAAVVNTGPLSRLVSRGSVARAEVVQAEVQCVAGVVGVGAYVAGSALRL